jgi:serine/threonine protein kinase
MTDSDPTPSREGEVLRGKYRLDKLLGSGGMAQVYKAHNTMAGRTVAIKVLFSALLADAEAVARFMREAKAANRVRHPNIADVLDVDLDDDGVPFLVQEYLEGEDLGEKMNCGWTPAPLEVLELFIPICEAVGAAHSRGVVHRDLKPENVLMAKIGNDLVPKVLDFGIAKIPFEQTNILKDEERRATWSDKRLTSAGSMLGTPNYMSPEQIKDTRSVDSRTDVWSLGVMMYEALTGDLPFAAGTVVELLSVISTTEAPQLSRRAPDTPEMLSQVVQRCLRQEARMRYADASAVAVALREVYDFIGPTTGSQQGPASRARDISQPEPARAPAQQTQPSAFDHYADSAGLLDQGPASDIEPISLADPGEPLTSLTPSTKPILSSSGMPAPPLATSVPADVSRALGLAISAALSRFALQGSVVVRNGSAELHGTGNDVVSIDVRDLLQNWTVLPEDIQDKRAHHAAQRLKLAFADIERAPMPMPTSAIGGRLAAVAVIGIVILAGVYGIQRSGMLGNMGHPGDDPSSTSSGAIASAPKSACETTRRRIQAGAAMGDNLDGWIVELWLATSKAAPVLAKSSAITELRNSAAQRLGAKGDTTISVVIDDSLAPIQSVLVRMSEGFAKVFFEAKGRETLVSLVEQTADNADAEYAALFARCANLDTRDAGAWYAGRDHARAAAAVAYAGGAFAEPPTLAVGKLGGPAKALVALGDKAQSLARDDIAKLLETNGAKLVEKSHGHALTRVFVRYPVDAPTGPAIASQALVNELKPQLKPQRKP